jgi:hypothetical protein
MSSLVVDIIANNYTKIEYHNPNERAVFEKILRCKTEAVPGLYTRCTCCHALHPVYKSCKDRLCPVCNKSASLKWAARQETRLLCVPYFMLTFTIPFQLRSVFLANKKTCYSMLFQSVSSTIIEGVLRNDKIFHGHAGFIALLHTWDQRLNYHPHIHVMVPGGCLNETKTEWIPSHPSFFVPVKRLSQQFKKRLLALLSRANAKGKLYLPRKYKEFGILLDMLEKKSWVVHSQATGKQHHDPVALVRYMSRYVAKSALSDKKVLRVDANKIALRYFDRKNRQPKKEIITETECMRRLVYHVLPKGFKKVRCYGFLANRHGETLIALCRMLKGEPLADQQTHDIDLLTDTAFLFWRYFRIDITLCTECKCGHIEYIKIPFPGG